MFRKAAKGSFGSFSAREALFAAFFAGGFLMATWITRTPAIREGLGLSIAEMGLVFLGLSLGSIPSLIFAPVLIHRAGARLMTLLGEALILLGVFLAALPLALPMPLPGGVVTALGLGLVGFGSVFLDIAMNVAAGVIEARRGKPVLTHAPCVLQLRRSGRRLFRLRLRLSRGFADDALSHGCRPDGVGFPSLHLAAKRGGGARPGVG